MSPIETRADETSAPSATPPVAELFARQRREAANSLFANKALLDPSRPTTEIFGRSDQYRELVEFLVDLDHGYLPPLIQVYGPSGSGKTTVVREVTAEAARQFPDLRVVQANLKQCRSLYAVANRILTRVSGSREPPVSGLDGAFEKIWTATRGRRYLLLVLDEADAAFGMVRDNPSDFVYRLVRHRDPNDPPVVGLITITNRLFGLESLLDSRVTSSMGTRNVFFPPYGRETLIAILRARESAFRAGALDPGTLSECARLASEEHGDARRALDLLRMAGELADRGKCPKVFSDHLWRAQSSMDGEAISRIIFALPDQEVVVLEALGALLTHEFQAEVTTEELYRAYVMRCEFWGLEPRGRRRFSDFLSSIETHGLVESTIESSGRYGRRKFVSMKPDVLATDGSAFNCLRGRHRPELLLRSCRGLQ